LTDGGPVREHYASESITERVLTALRNANGPDVPITPETLAPIDHFHWKGVIATEGLVAELQPKASDKLLDIGCGIGGPARWIAAKYGCRVTRVDLTAEFCAAAQNSTGLRGSPIVSKSCTATLSRFHRRTIALIAPTRRQP
jgi:2-polyprenyl-3-methyl-5-hydroxy-6-metoxy-1,4-benzoquinol methylase